MRQRIRERFQLLIQHLQTSRALLEITVEPADFVLALTALSHVARENVEQPLGRERRNRPAQPPIIAVPRPETILEIQRRVSFENTGNDVIGCNEIVGMNELLQRAAMQLVSLITERFLPRR